MFVVDFGATLQSDVAADVTDTWTTGPNLGDCDLPLADDPKSFCAGPIVHGELSDPDETGDDGHHVRRGIVMQRRRPARRVTTGRASFGRSDGYTRRVRQPVLFALGLLTLVAVQCGARTGLLAPEPDGSLPDVREIDVREEDVHEEDAVFIDATGNCPPEATLIYVTGEGGALYSFWPPSFTFTFIGNLTCTTAPTHMTVDRHGVGVGGRCRQALSGRAPSTRRVWRWATGPLSPRASATSR